MRPLAIRVSFLVESYGTLYDVGSELMLEGVGSFHQNVSHGRCFLGSHGRKWPPIYREANAIRIDADVGYDLFGVILNRHGHLLWAAEGPEPTVGQGY